MKQSSYCSNIAREDEITYVVSGQESFSAVIEVLINVVFITSAVSTCAKVRGLVCHLLRL